VHGYLGGGMGPNGHAERCVTRHPAAPVQRRCAV